MTLEHLGKCSFCGSDILFEGKSSLVKCPNCGETMAVATFLNEEIRLEQAQQEAAEAKKALDAAMQAKEAALEEKKEAEQRVFRAITRLEDLSLSQSEQKESLEKLLSGQEASKKETEALHQLLDALYGTQETQQDALTELLSAVLRGQETTDGKLNALQKISETLLQSQDDILSLTQYLKTDNKEKNRLLGRMFLWAQNADKETVRRLEALQAGSVTLQSSLNEIDRKIDGLSNRITDVSNQIDRFESSWKQSILTEITGLYDQAESTQRSRDFDQAEQYYREILIKGGKDPEVYWRLILCHYCVEYQEDDDGRWLPTILYPSLDDPRTLQEWKDLSGKCKDSPELLEHYEKLLKPIEEIIRQYCQFRQTVTPQVFICVKQKENTLWTTDSDTGSELYDLVRGYNLSVFNSRRTQIPAGEKYEPFIIAALLSARLMIVVGTSPDRMESRWVKNEWSRFQWLQAKEIKQTGKTDRKLVCYLKGMNPKDIPDELHPNIQAIVESTTSVKALDNLLKRTFPEPKSIPVPTPTLTPFEVVCEQMEIWLEIGEYDKVSQKYANMVDREEYINEPRLHLYALCAKKEVAGFEQLTALKLDLEKEKLFSIARKRAVTQSDKELIKKLLGTKQTLPPLDDKKSKRTIAIVIPIIVACIAFIVIRTTIIIPKQKLNKAMGLLDSGDYEAAYALLEEIGKNDMIASSKYDRAVALIDSGDYEAAYVLLNGLDFKDSVNRLKSIKLHLLSKTKVGDYVVFGAYEQDNNTSNGQEDVEWLVLAKEGDRLLVISKYALDCKKYNSYYSDVTWETCTLRTWLNGTFINNTFSSDEQTMIQSITVTADKNPLYSTPPGNNTTDKVFLLSISESNNYFSSISARQCKGTEYCYAQGAFKSSNNGNCWWWLRSPGGSSRSAMYINNVGSYGTNGSYGSYGYNVNSDSVAVRPALWIKLGS